MGLQSEPLDQEALKHQAHVIHVRWPFGLCFDVVAVFIDPVRPASYLKRAAHSSIAPGIADHSLKRHIYQGKAPWPGTADSHSLSLRRSQLDCGDHEAGRGLGLRDPRRQQDRESGDRN